MAGLWEDYNSYGTLDTYRNIRDKHRDQLTFSQHLELWSKTEKNYFDKEAILQLEEKYDFWRSSSRWVRNINLMMVKVNDFDKVNKDNIVNYRNNWLFEFNAGKSGEEGVFKILKKALYRLNGLEDIQHKLEDIALFLDSTSSTLAEENPQVLVEIWKHFRTAAGLRELENFAESIEYAESNMDLRLNDQDNQTMSQILDLGRYLESTSDILQDSKVSSYMLMAWELNRMRIYFSVYTYEQYR